MSTGYDAIGRDYARHRRPDPRWAARILVALGGAQRVVNVGAGTGSYEPVDRAVVAVEPSAVMIAQRPARSAPFAAGRAEALPFGPDTFDAALAVLTVHHWTDVDRGLGELARVAARRVLVVWDPDAVRATDFWLAREYFPQLGLDLTADATWPAVRAAFPRARVEVLTVPHDCTDGFAAAYWRRPEAYLDPGVRGAISSFARRDDAALADGLRRLRADVASGAWHARHGDLLGLDELDLGYRLVVDEG